MSNDISQLLPTFIEESLENLDEMEETLISLDLEKIDIEKINTIFRAAHTLKGNSGIFKFTEIRDLMHSLETYLDLVRKGQSAFKKQHQTLFFQAIDVVRTMLYEIKKGEVYDGSLCVNLNQTLNELLKTENLESKKTMPISSVEKKEKTTPELEFSEKPTASESAERKEGWFIKFSPNSNCFKMGRDPGRLFSALEEFGPVEIEPELSNLVDFISMDPSLCYLTWSLKIMTKVQKQDIEKILLWGANEDEFEVQPLNKPKLPLQEKMSAKQNVSNSIRVATEKIDHLINTVGEMVIAESMLKDIINKLDPKKQSNVQERIDLLEHNTKQLQDNVLRVRMVPVSFAISRFPRMVLDIADKMGKKVAFTITGEETEVDKGMIEKISDPLLHLIRNAVDHGIEFPETRNKLNKNPVGSLQLSAYQEGNNIVIQLTDDGQGIDFEKVKKIAIEKQIMKADEKLNEQELINLIFRPGFTTSEEVTELSGRGIGLDVVEKNVRSLGGKVEVYSTKGSGTTFKISLPLTLAIIDCQLIRIASQTYALPLVNIQEMQPIDLAKISFKNNKSIYMLRNQEFEIIFLDKLLQIDRAKPRENKAFLLMTENNGKKYGLVCDELLLQQPVVIKNLEENFHKVFCVMGASILGDGTLALILDVKEIVEGSQHNFLKNELIHQKKILNVENNNENIKGKSLNDHENEVDFISFCVGKYEYGIDMKDIKEICLWQKPFTLPFSEPYLLGVINLRGQIVPLVDLKILFSNKSENIVSKMIVIIELTKDNEKKSVGIVVDSITDIYSIKKDEIRSIPSAGYLILRQYLIGLVIIQKRLISLLSVKKLIPFPAGVENIQ